MSVNQRQPDGTLKKIAGLGQYDVPIDSSLSPTSTNPVQNKVITEELLKKATQYATLPTASSANEGAIVQYIGTDSTNYSIGGFYQCQEDSGAYSWVFLSQQITVDSTLSPTSENPVQNKVINTALSSKLDSNKVGVASGVAELDSNGKVPSSQLPSYVDDIIEGYYNETDGKFYEESTYTTEITGEAGKIYVSLDTDLPYRWSGSAFIEIPWGLALGETSSTAYRGDRGKTAYDHATDSGRLTTVTVNGLYKIGVTAEGHVASATAVAKADITALGIPAQDTTYTPEKLGIGYGTCTTAAATASKAVTLANYNLVKNGIISVKFTNAVPASATLNVNSKGAKSIFYKGAAIVANVIRAGDTATFMYDGTQYHLLGVDRSAIGEVVFRGTKSAWNALSSTIKAMYTVVIITDD